VDARQRLRTGTDPGRDLRGRLQHDPTLTDLRKVGGLLRDINACEDGIPAVRMQGRGCTSSRWRSMG
jgi:hypothetical protein